MISIGPQFKVIDLLWELLSSFGPEHQVQDHLQRKLFGLLSSRRYLIVLDDVWTESLWDELRNVLPDDNNGSRVLITSRIMGVSRSADKGMVRYKLPRLSLEKSVDLLLKNALPLQKPHEVYQSDLLHVARKLSSLYCRGLPLFLVVLGKILSTKDPTPLAWERALGLMLGKKWITMWDQLERAFLHNDTLPDNMDETLLLMTVEHIAQAKLADPNIAPNEHHFLDEAQSRELLLKKAFPYQECPSDLLELAHKISINCRGLRLALIVVGCILRTKDKTKNAWESVWKKMYSCNLDDESKWSGMNILNMSYEDMSYYLKACFLYLASFPRNNEIPAKRLIRMWIAEGFIPKQETKTMEETAEDCLEQLFQRNIIRVTCRYSNGSIKYCQVHGSFVDFAMHQAKMENFLAEAVGYEVIDNSRRAFIQSHKSAFMGYVGLNIRSLLLFGSRDYLPNYSEYRLLRVLEIEGVKIPRDITGLEQLIHLKYLGFRNCEGLIISKCPFGQLRNLETLDLRGILMLSGASTDIWTIGTLRHVLFEPFQQYNLELPTWVDLRNLQTVKWVSDSDTDTPTNQFPILSNMRKLGLTNCKNWDLVSCRLAAMPSLISLGIVGENIPENIVYPTSLPNYMNLQTLCLVGKWSEGTILEASFFPPHLVKLELFHSELAQDPMPELGKLNSLKKLVLSGGVYTGEQLFCPAGFPVLQKLKLFVYGLKELTVKNGVMPKLKYLRRPPSLKLELPPDLKHSVGNA